MSERFELRSEFAFEAAHHLPEVPPHHRCSRVHGHSYKVQVRVRGPLDEARGWIMDLAAIEEFCHVVRSDLDHRLLNDLPGLKNPTSELLARWVWQKLIDDLPGLVAVEVRETDRSSCVYRGDEL
jgi:6-pyruvoyltetrahydropterin/6-carboxytetrahydropterin synthase